MKRNLFYIIAIAVVITACKKDVPVDVTLNVTTLVLLVDNSETLTASILPNNASDKVLTWTSSNPAVATIANGTITAVAEGRTIISVSTEDGDKTASCAVVVTTRQMNMTSLAPSVTINLGGLGPVTINWGDGTESETHILSQAVHSDSASYTHNYSDGYAHAITITSENIREMVCDQNQLTSLDVSKNTALSFLYCAYNLLTTLDVSRNTMLTYLSCTDNQLTSLDVSKNTSLTTLLCGYNQLTSLDLSKNMALNGLNCSANQLTNLDVRNNTMLQTLDCFYNQLTSLNVSRNIRLIGLRCGGNLLSASALDDLFRSLHHYDVPYIWKRVHIGDNPGTYNCNKNIAEDKGWEVTLY